MTASDLQNAPDPPRVALVTGATRGIGKGVALALGDAGYTVYLTGRTATGPLSLAATAAQVRARGGEPVPIVCDHADDGAVAAVFDAVRERSGHLDLLVNNVFAIPAEDIWTRPFWEQPIAQWDAMHTVGLRSHFVASWHAVPLLRGRANPLIVNISSFAGAGYQLNVAYGVGKAGVDRLAADMGHELHGEGVAVVSLWPGVVRTEWVLSRTDLPFPMVVTESPEFTGRAVAALAADRDVMARTGGVHIVAELAEAYGFTDTDGAQPISLRAFLAGVGESPDRTP